MNASISTCAAGRVLDDGRQQASHFVEFRGYCLIHNLKLSFFIPNRKVG